MKVWFNQGLSNTFDALHIIRDADAANAITLLASHANPSLPISRVAHHVFAEPPTADDDSYVAWCLARCAEYGVDVFIPQRRREAIAARRSAFAAQGIALSLMGDAGIMAMVDRKDALYDDLSGTDVPVPPYRRFRTVAEFDAAADELGDAAHGLCVKPSVGVYGAGFRILERSGCELKRILSGDGFRTSFDAFRAALAESAQDRDMMLMAYLPGVERSVDVLAHRGRIACAVARVKVGSHQVLETDGVSVDIAARLTERYGLDGMFNVQTREWDGIPYLLEINSRMSGGLLYSCQSGVALPYWAVLLAAGKASPEDVPAPMPGVRVAPVQGCVRL